MVQFSSVQSIFEIDPREWQQITPSNFPFWDYPFLAALETGQCLGKRTGWFPQYLLAREDGRLVGAMPLFYKTNSYGEYIFDWQWAEAYERAGLPYYPKLVSATPFTPAVGPKILLRPGIHPDLAGQLLDEALRFSKQNTVSSFHALFVTEEERSLWESRGFADRLSQQYHWFNSKYESFDDFLSSLKGKRRRQIQKEREQIKTSQLAIECLTGQALQKEHGSIFYSFYLSTIDKKFGLPYLTEEFFTTVIETMKNQILLLFAKDQMGRNIAGSISFMKGSNLYGRYWGSLEEYRHLHFELCYYQLIEHCIRHRFEKFEAGAQGPHKIQRGFRPTPIYSAHLIKHPQFKTAIEEFIKKEKVFVMESIKEESSHLPFK